MDRGEAAAYIGMWYGNYLEEVGRSVEDSDGNLKPAIDAALRALGVAEADLPASAPADREGYEAQLEYHALRLVVSDLGTYMSTSLDRIGTFRLDMIRKHAAQDLEAARSRVLELFGTTRATAAGSSGVLKVRLGFLEPARGAGEWGA